MSKIERAENLSRESLLSQLREEYLELGAAIEKYARAITGENPAPKGEVGAKESLLEELADVFVCVDALFSHERQTFAFLADIAAYKKSRWKWRLFEAGKSVDEARKGGKA